jgi:hypothetical protein
MTYNIISFSIIIPFIFFLFGLLFFNTYKFYREETTGGINEFNDEKFLGVYSIFFLFCSKYTDNTVIRFSHEIRLIEGKVLILSAISKTYDYLSDFGTLWNA